MPPKPARQVKSRPPTCPRIASCWPKVFASGALGALASGVVLAAGESGASSQDRTLTFAPSVSVTQVFTDNHLLSEAGRSDAITRLNAGVGVRTRTAAVQGLLDYNLVGAVYARHSDQNAVQNSLNANVLADLVENRLRLNASARISQGAVSAFGVQPGSGSSANTNSTEVRSLQVVPSLRGFLGPSVQYAASLSHAITDASGQTSGDSTSTTLNLRLEPRAAGRIGWSIDASHLTSDFKRGRATQSNRLFAGLRSNLDELDLVVDARAGVEQSDLTSLQLQSAGTWGVGAVWTPSPRTRFSADLDQRAYGRSHSVSAEHRMARLSFRLRSARSLSTSGALTQGGQDVIYQLVALEFASIADPIQRDAAIRRRLVQLNLDPTRVLSAGFLSSAVTLQDTQEFSMVWSGPRDSLSASVSRSQTQRADTVSASADDLSQAGVVTLSNLSLSWSHRLTPGSSLALTLTALRGDGDTAAQSNRQTRMELAYSTSLTPESSATVSLRRGLYKTALQPYDESVLTASYGIRF
jgi:uncharacterized protein (PEP-CTERM system associated)